MNRGKLRVSGNRYAPTIVLSGQLTWRIPARIRDVKLDVMHCVCTINNVVCEQCILVVVFLGG
jgi:hypothetical protein